MNGATSSAPDATPITTAVVAQTPTPPPQHSLAVVNPEVLILTAIEKNVPVETLEKLLAMRDKLVAEQARNAFFNDLAEFQRECPVIVKDKDVLNKPDSKGQQSVRYRYAPLDSIVRQIGTRLADYGFSYQFVTSSENQCVQVTCHARHRMGHTESTTFTSNIDPQAFMNLAQKFGSALTFGKRYAFLAAFGIMTGEDDDDGQSTTESAGQKTAREKLEEINQKARAAKQQEEPKVYHQTEETAEETAAMGVLTDFLTVVAECNDAEALTQFAHQSGDFEGSSQQAAKRAVANQAKVLGLTWDRSTAEFVKKGGA
jgi:hypothetical protein